MELKEIAQSIKEAREKIFLIYAFNGTGKTRLSTEYKEIARNEEGHQTGVYYNAFSEDLFVWDNDIEHAEENVRLKIKPSSLNRFHSLIDEDKVREKLKPYNPKYGFDFHSYENPEKGLEYVSFHTPSDKERNIKISRGEERIFIWCFFLALFDVEGWADQQNEYFFIDDPVSSLDDHNIFITAFTLFELIKKYYESREIIITTHHIGFASILGNWLSDTNNPFVGKKRDRQEDKKNEKGDKYALRGLSYNDGTYYFTSFKRSTNWLYHLRLMQVLNTAIQHDDIGDGDGGLEIYHVAILRQLLENISSFLGAGRISYVLEQIGYVYIEANEIALKINALTHRDVYLPQSNIMTSDNKALVKEIFSRIQNKYNFQFKK